MEPAVIPQPISTTMPFSAPSAPDSQMIYSEILSEIIQEQDKIIGVLALEQTAGLAGLTVDPMSFKVTLTDNGARVIDRLISRYQDYFGHAAVEVCKEAASAYISRLPADGMPVLLR